MNVIIVYKSLEWGLTDDQWVVHRCTFTDDVFINLLAISMKLWASQLSRWHEETFPSSCGSTGIQYMVVFVYCLH